MADFSEYTGPSADWIALEPTLPPLPDLPILELRNLVNKGREELAAHGVKNIGMHIQAIMPEAEDCTATKPCISVPREQFTLTLHGAS